MIAKLDKNEMKSSLLEMSAKGIVPETAVLRNVRVSKAKDADGNFTGQTEAIRYDLVDPTTFASFTVKVEEDEPVITRDELEKSDEPVFVTIPVEETVVKPYEITYGIAKVSIVAPYIKLEK